ncbi:unnamed protein product [Porites lobata]|uniref:Nephrocystin-3 n=1 Tax=Porites lobata TaxID=104759 RepID=A0ABN8PXJ7_9CNID|nr:unnamed protein product [Porites lobata]
MALSKNYTEEQLNYFRICYITTDILAEGLRELFKREWDNQYKSTPLGEWKDVAQNGTDFYNGESPRNQRRNARLLATMINGNRAEWDCTMLFYAILYSGCVGPYLASTVRNNVDDLRKFRNEEFAHILQGSLPEMDFQNAVGKVHVAFHALGLSTVKIDEIKNQKTFPMDELDNILKEVDDVRQELQEKENQRQVLKDQLHKEAPSFCILPPKPTHEIESREREVAEIAHQLKELKKANENRLSYLYISGNPGSGKSQLAGLVAERFFDEEKEIPGTSFVMTINAASQDSLLESYANFARQLKCPEFSVMQTLSFKDWNIEDKIANLKMLIAAKMGCYTSWLMVVDNVTNLTFVHDHLPQSGTETWARGHQGMNPYDATSLLAKLSGVFDKELAENVARKLDYQPLALAGAAVFVKDIRQDKASKHFGWDEYLKILQKGKRETTEDTLADTNPIYPNTMTTAITLAVEALVKSDKIFEHVIRFLSLCAPQPLNVDIAVSYLLKVLEHDDKEDKEQIRRRFRRCSLLLLEEEGDSCCYIRVHQVVHDAMKWVMSECTENQTINVVSEAVTSFNKFIVTIPHENRTMETMHIIPHVSALIGPINAVIMAENMSQVHVRDISEKLSNLGDICKMHSEFNVAKTYLENSLALRIRLLGDQNVDVASGYNNLALVYMALGDLEQAKEYQQRGLAIQLKKLGAEHVSVATSYGNLALIHKDLGDPEQAKEYQQRGLAIQLKKLGAEHVSVATSYGNLALIHQDLGDREQAKEYQQRGLAIKLKKLGAEHVSVATSYGNLALIHKDLGDLEQAKEYQQRGFAIKLKNLGAEHVSVATSYCNLALIHQDLGDLEQAKEYQQRGLATDIKKLGAEHVSVATSYGNLALIHQDLGDLEQAKEYQQRGLAIQLKKLGAEHVSVATSYGNLAAIHKDLGDLEQAKEYQQRGLAIQLKKLGAEHVSVATSYGNLASIHQDLGDLEQAKEYQQRGLAIFLKKLGAEHVSVATSYGNLALVYKALGDLEQAKEYQQRCLAIKLKKLGAEHVSVATSYGNLALVYRALGDLEQAKEYQQRGLAIELKKLGAEHVSVATSYGNLALVYRALGLRELFKREWDNQYRSTPLGEWKDVAQNGTDFYNGESPRNQRRNAHLLATMISGSRAEWDCTMLFYAILYSDCVGPYLASTVRNNVDNLRNFRNEEFAHIPQGSFPEIDFQNAISKVHVAFHALGLSTVKIDEIKNQKTFPTDELDNILKEIDDLKQELQEKENQRQVLEDQLQKEAPSFCILPPKPTHEIESREREVAQIAHQLSELKKANENRLSYLYISGNPGSGKSQLAGLVAKKIFDEVKEIPGTSSFVMTINAASQNSLLESYANFARQLKCPDFSVIQTLSSKDWNIEEKIANLKMLIAAKIGCYTSWLMVVDNVTKLNFVHDHLPQSGTETWAKGQLLITTQDTKSIPLKSSFINHISVSQGMNPYDATSLLAKLSGVFDNELAENVAQKLDYQPLALAGAAVFVKDIRQDKASKHFGWDEYLKILQKGKRETTEDTLVDTNPIYPNTMTTAITLAVEAQVRSDKFFEHLSRFLSLCAPQPLNVDIAVSYLINVLHHDDKEDKEHIRRRFRTCSLLLLKEDEDSCFYIRIHQVVHDAMKWVMSDCTENQTIKVVSEAVTSFNKFIATIPHERRTMDTMYIIPHIRALITPINTVITTENVSQVYVQDISEKLSNLGNICKMHCEFNVAEKYLKSSLAVRIRLLGDQNVDVASGYNDLALVYKALGDPEQAKEYHQRGLAIQLKKLGAEHVSVATSYGNLATIHHDLGDLEQAKEYQQRGLAIELKKLGAEHVSVATSYGNLASIHKDLGDLEQAKEYQQRGLAIQLKKLGAEHIFVATSYGNLATIHKALGDLEQAKEYQQRGLAIKLKKLGAEHVSVATSYGNLASIHKDLGDLEQAKEYQQRALAIQLKKLGAEHVSVATSYGNLATIHKALGDLEQAKEYQQRGLAIFLKKLGAEHVSVATSYGNIALIHKDLGDLEQAKEYQQRALAIQLKKLSAEHVSVATSYGNLASIHHDLGDLEQAKEYQQRGLAIELKKLGAEHVSVATSYGNLASIHKDLGDLEQAKEYQQRGLAIFLKKLGAQHVSVATSYGNLASIHKALGDLEHAKEYQQRALAIKLKKLGAEHVSVATSYGHLASIHKDLGDLEQAKEYQQRALAMKLKKLF